MPEEIDVLGLAAHGGQAAILISIAAVGICALRVRPQVRRVRRKARLLEARARADREVLLDATAVLVAQGVEIHRLLRPWRRLLFWARHPLTRTLLRQYRPR